MIVKVRVRVMVKVSKWQMVHDSGIKCERMAGLVRAMVQHKET